MRSRFETLEGRRMLSAVDLLYDQASGSLSIRADQPASIFGIEIVLEGTDFRLLPSDPAPFENFLANADDDVVWASVDAIPVEGEINLGAQLRSGIANANELQRMLKSANYGDASGVHPMDLTVLRSNVLYLSFDRYRIGDRELREWSADWQTSVSDIDKDADGITVESFYADHADRDILIERIIELVNEDLSPFRIRAQRLTEEQSVRDNEGATTVFVGPSDVDGSSHIAGDTDIDNNNMVDVAFVGEEDWGTLERTAIATANAILHEAGHTFGLKHVSVGGDLPRALEVMSPVRSRLSDLRFVDSDFHQEDGGTQNSFRKMSEAFRGSNSLPPCFAEIDLFTPCNEVEPMPGDANGDGSVGFDDFLVVSANFGKPGDHSQGDFDGDGQVSFQDFLILSDHFGFVPVALPFGSIRLP